MKTWKELVSLVLILSLLCLALPTSPAVAGWAPTRGALDGPKARLVTMLERQDVAGAMQKLGLDPAEAVRRVAGLTDAEAQLALDRLDELPAGADSGIGTIVGAVLFVFIVLLITDLLGLTRFYPFTKKR
jgi:hypothetical protein